MAKYKRLLRSIVHSVDYWAQAAMRRFVLDLDHRMRAQNISRAALAEKLGTTPAYVTKVMRGDVNFTLETMTKLALAVGGRLHVQVVDYGAPAWVKNVVDTDKHRSESNVLLIDKYRQTTQAAETRRLELNFVVAANGPQYDYEKITDRVA